MTLDGHVPSTLGGPYPVRSGNLVRPLVDRVPAFRRIAEAIGEARHSLWLTVAFYAPDFRFPDGRGLFDVLDDAVARGLSGDRVNPPTDDIRSPATLHSRERQVDGSIGRISAG